MVCKAHAKGTKVALSRANVPRSSLRPCDERHHYDHRRREKSMLCKVHAKGTKVALSRANVPRPALATKGTVMITE